MTLAYLPEHAEKARFSLDLAERESKHLSYTTRTLFAQTIDLELIKAIATREDLAEKIDAFASRFGRLQDHIGEKLLPAFARLLGAQPKTLLDTLAYAERMQWLDSAEAFIGSRRLRNQLIHEYLTDPELFLEALRTAQEATDMLMAVVANMRKLAEQLHLPSS